jgi:hypothetical protein
MVHQPPGGKKVRYCFWPWVNGSAFVPVDLRVSNSSGDSTFQKVGQQISQVFDFQGVRDF